jgi:beta-glucosidase
VLKWRNSKTIPNITGIVWTGFNGQAQGEAIASILFGEANPGGKLNATWYKTVNDLPAITDYTLRGGNGKNGRTFWYFNKDVSYEFGFGLSYTTFEYSNFRINKNTITPHDKITISVDVKNTGTYDGDEVVQIYMKTPDSPASQQRPAKRLQGFKRVTIPVGQTKTVDIDVDCTNLYFWDGVNEKITYDQGRYIFEVGASSKDIKGTVSATMNGTFIPEIKTVVADCDVVVMRIGASTQTNVTAALSDDSFYDISKAKVVYTSNNPAVASVDEKGRVTAKGVGVASITAHVTIDGKTKSDDFALKIMPNLNLTSISIDGKNIQGFNPTVTGYSYLKNTSTQAPVVSATSADPAVGVDIIQAKGIPGSAKITLTDYVSVDKNEYSVNFGIKSVSDEFKSNILGSHWNWIRENKSNWSLSKNPGSMVIKGEKGDILGAANTAENILLQSANTDWVITTKITLPRKPSSPNEQAGLIAWQDDDNFVKLVYRSNSRGFRPGAAAASSGVLDMIVEENGYNFSLANMRSPDILGENELSVILKLERKGAVITGSYSKDGKNFTKIGTANILLNDTKAGMIVCNGVEMAGRPGMPQMQRAQTPAPALSDFEVAFDYFKITNSGLK